MERLEGAIFKFFEKLSKTNLLILDDFGLTYLEKQQQVDLMEIIEDRHGKASTIIASQLPVLAGMISLERRRWPMRYWTGWYTHHPELK